MQEHAHIFYYLRIDMNTPCGLLYVTGREIGNGVAHIR